MTEYDDDYMDVEEEKELAQEQASKHGNYLKLNVDVEVLESVLNRRLDKHITEAVSNQYDLLLEKEMKFTRQEIANKIQDEVKSYISRTLEASINEQVLIEGKTPKQFVEDVLVNALSSKSTQPTFIESVILHAVERCFIPRVQYVCDVTKAKFTKKLLDQIDEFIKQQREIEE